MGAVMSNSLRLFFITILGQFIQTINYFFGLFQVEFGSKLDYSPLQCPYRALAFVRYSCTKSISGWLTANSSKKLKASTFFPVKT